MKYHLNFLKGLNYFISKKYIVKKISPQTNANPADIKQVQTPACYATGKNCYYTLSSFKHRKKIESQESNLLRIMKTPFIHHLKKTS